MSYAVKQVSVGKGKGSRRWTITQSPAKGVKVEPVSFMGVGKLNLRRKVDALNIVQQLNKATK